MHQAIGWLLEQYGSVKLWMGLETSDEAELYLTCSPSQSKSVVSKLKVYDDALSIFETPIAVGE